MLNPPQQNVVVLPRPGKLTQIGDVRRELASIYRDTRQGKLDPADLTRYAFALKVLKDMIVDEKLDELAVRIQDLEWKNASNI